MPLVDKPEWIHHGGVSIFGVDIDASGERIATAGSDNKIRIWSLGPVISETMELNAAVPKQLAVLSESTTPVNCVRFAPTGRLLAAGSDDSDGYLFELREGRSKAAFGSGEAGNIENWKLCLRLRGHEVNVADVAWAPDSRRLATASVDNKVKIWDATSSHCLRTLEGHRGHVKGVAWDPFDIYLASQGDREVIVWRLEDGQPVARIKDPFESSPIVSFSLRPAWSPDGQVLALPNGYDKGVHVVPLIRRNTWSWSTKDFSLVGHHGPILVVRFNPHLYLLPVGNGSEGPAADDDSGAGAIPAVGSNDKSFSVWHPGVSKPLVVGNGFFKGMVVDMAWSPDGRVLVVASQDGSVATVVFKEGELGRRVPEVEVQALLSKLYGDPGLRNRKSALTAAPDLLQLESRARADVEREERLNNRLGPGAAGAAGMQLPPATAGGALRPPMPRLQQPAPSVPMFSTSNGAGIQPHRVPPQQAAAPILQQPFAVSGVQWAASPAKTAAAGTSGRAGGAAGVSGGDHDAPPAKRPALQPVQTSGAVPAQARSGSNVGRPGSTAGRTATYITGGAAPTATNDVFGSAAPAVTAGEAPGASSAATAPAFLVPPDPVRPILAALIHMQGSAGAGEPQVPWELQAVNTGRDSRQRPVSELVCLAGPQRQWSDTLQGHIIALAGSNRFAAAATASGDLMIYSPAGRRLTPPIQLGFPVSFLWAGSGTSVLLALQADGKLQVWDFAAGKKLLEASVAPLLTGSAAQQGLKVAAVRLSAVNCPVVVLTNAYAFVYDMGICCWMRVADDAFPASVYTSALTPAKPGELSKLQQATALRRHPYDVLAMSTAQAARPAAAKRSEQALLEHNLAAAAVLQSPAEWRQWLAVYVHQLCKDDDEARLRELISELMGPVRYSSSTHEAAGVGPSSRSSSQGRGTGGTSAAFEPPLASSVVGYWQPSILGFDKRRLLRELVLKEVAMNRNYQHLVSEALEQLKYVEGSSVQPGISARQTAF